MFSMLLSNLDIALFTYYIKQQNEILEKLEASLINIANNSTDRYSFWATVIFGLITFYLGWQQNKISKKQHNLELLNKRWVLLEEFKLLEKNFFDMRRDVAEVGNENLSQTYALFNEKFMLLNQQIRILFGEDTFNNLETFRNHCREYHEKQIKYFQVKREERFLDLINEKDEYESIREKLKEIEPQIGKMQLENINLWIKNQEKLLFLIRSNMI